MSEVFVSHFGGIDPMEKKRYNKVQQVEVESYLTCTKLEKCLFTKRPLKMTQLSKIFQIPKVTCIVTSPRNSRTILNDFQAKKMTKGSKNDKKGPKGL
jgi:hypothetical protein